jgi:transcriptional regulator with XRE-family HTH domain
MLSSLCQPIHGASLGRAVILPQVPDVPKQIRELRIEKYLTQAEVAELVGVTEDAVASWESGRRRPRFRHQRKLAEVLGRQPGELEYPTRTPPGRST